MTVKTSEATIKKLKINKATEGGKGQKYQGETVHSSAWGDCIADEFRIEARYVTEHSMLFTWKLRTNECRRRREGKRGRGSEIPLEQRVLMQPRAIWFMSRGIQRQVGTSCWTSTSLWLPVRDAKLIRQAARAATQTHLYIYVYICIYRYIFCNQLGAGISFEQ